MPSLPAFPPGAGYPTYTWWHGSPAGSTQPWNTTNHIPGLRLSSCSVIIPLHGSYMLSLHVFPDNPQHLFQCSFAIQGLG